jgi:hypothetical protein
MSVSIVVNTASPDAEFFPTPAWATEALLARVTFTNPVWECAAGSGAMADVLAKAGYAVLASDLCDRGNPSIQSGVDFLSVPTVRVGSVITNPPFSLAEEFIAKALDCADHRVAMLLRLAFLEGQRRKILWTSTPLEQVLVFSRRLSFGRAVKIDENANGKIAFAWFVWTRGFKGEPKIAWI